jgi:membrane protease YdiL (CAAX protease family)
MGIDGRRSRLGGSGAALSKIFRSDVGLRVGWRFTLFNVLFFVIAFGLLLLRRVLTPGGFKGNSFTAPVVALQESLFLIALVLDLAVMLKIEHKPFVLDFLPLRGGAARHIGVGIAAGLGAISLVIAALAAVHALSFGSIALHGLQAATSAIWWAVAFLLVGLYEESFSRGYALATLSEGLGFWPAAIVTSLLFAGIHLTNRGETLLGILSVFCIAVLFCFTLWRTGALWFAVGFHAAWDYGQTFIYGVPDSAEVATRHLLNVRFHGPPWVTGGSVGPEGSVFTFVVYGVLALLFELLCPKLPNVAPGEKGECRVL